MACLTAAKAFKITYCIFTMTLLVSGWARVFVHDGNLIIHASVQLQNNKNNAKITENYRSEDQFNLVFSWRVSATALIN